MNGATINALLTAGTVAVGLVIGFYGRIIREANKVIRRLRGTGPRWTLWEMVWLALAVLAARVAVATAILGLWLGEPEFTTWLTLTIACTLIVVQSRENRKLKARLAKLDLAVRAKTPNEIRAAAGLPPVDGTNKPDDSEAMPW